MRSLGGHILRGYHENRILGASVLLVLAPDLAPAQQPTSSNFVFPSGMGNTGVFRIPAEEGEVQVQVELRAEGNHGLRYGAATPSGPSVIRLYWPSSGRTRITAPGETCQGRYHRAEGHIFLRTQARSVGASRHRGRCDRATIRCDRRSSEPLSARLTVQPPGSSSIEGGRAVLGTDDRGVQFVASVHNAAGGLINANEFPMKWSVSNPRVLAIEKAYDHTVFLNAVGAGTSTVTASVEGISQSFDVTVQKGAPAAGKAGTLATRTVRAQAAPRSGGEAPSLVNAPLGRVVTAFHWIGFSRCRD